MTTDTISPYLVAIHDVMPETLPHVARILALLEEQHVRPVTLLVVPGRDWTGAGLAQLKAWEAAGHVLGGHGWLHQVDEIRGWWHWLHSATLSRNVAEHLALDEGGIAALIQRNHDWFREHGLQPPELYVAPAWAMGRIGPATLQALPFRYYEYLSGVYDAKTGAHRVLPLTGYEADTKGRAIFLRWFNRLNAWLARVLRRPLRIGIHPYDLDYYTADQLRGYVARAPRCIGYPEVLSKAAQANLPE